VRVPYTEGTLVIDLRDPSTRSLVWRSIAREDEGDASKIEGKLDDMVKKSFDKYSPRRSSRSITSGGRIGGCHSSLWRQATLWTKTI
jgi:hypothetical protein